MTAKKSNKKEPVKQEEIKKEVIPQENKKAPFLEANHIFAKQEKVKYTFNFKPIEKTLRKIKCFILIFVINVKVLLFEKDEIDNSIINYVRGKYG